MNDETLERIIRTVLQHTIKGKLAGFDIDDEEQLKEDLRAIL